MVDRFVTGSPMTKPDRRGRRGAVTERQYRQRFVSEERVLDANAPTVAVGGYTCAVAVATRFDHVVFRARCQRSAGPTHGESFPDATEVDRLAEEHF